MRWCTRMALWGAKVIIQYYWCTPLPDTPPSTLPLHLPVKTITIICQHPDTVTDIHVRMYLLICHLLNLPRCVRASSTSILPYHPSVIGCSRLQNQKTLKKSNLFMSFKWLFAVKIGMFWAPFVQKGDQKGAQTMTKSWFWHPFGLLSAMVPRTCLFWHKKVI